MLSWMNWCCFPYYLPKKPLSHSTLTTEFKNENNLLHLQIWELKKSMITLQYSTRLPGNDPFWYHILWQSQPEAHFLQTPKYSCAETSFHWRCPVVLLNHSQAPLPSLWEKSAKATACLPRLWLTHGYDVTAQSRACGKQTEKQVLLSCFR